jgi:benzil reductase ((S)-benzoin forming)
MSAHTILWISGASAGIGLGLARNAPFPGARIINLSRTPNPALENIAVDITRPESWDAVRRHFRYELGRFTGARAVFIQNAYDSNAVGLIGKVPSEAYEKSVLGNVAAPLVLGEAFLSACRSDYESGLVLLSSGAAVTPLEGLASYCAGKAAIEHWAEVVARERESRGGTGPWVVAVRPGGVDTAPVRASAALDPKVYPRAKRIMANISNRLDIDSAARHIWGALPPDPGTAILSFANPPRDEAMRFGGSRVKTFNVPGWELVYV